MKNPILIISILINAILLGIIGYKYSLKTHPSHSVFDKIMQGASKMSMQNAREYYKGMQSTLVKMPRMQEGINTNMEDVQKQTKKGRDWISGTLARLEKATGGDIHNRRKTHRSLFKGDSAKVLLQSIQVTKESMDSSFLNALQAINKERRRKINVDSIYLKTRELTLQFQEDELDKLRYATYGEARLILRKWHLNLSLHESILMRVIHEQIPPPRVRLDQYVAIMNAKKGVVRVGEPFEAEVAIGAYSSEFAKSSSITVNGKKYELDENGTARFSERPTRVGTHKLKLRASIKNPLSGETMSGSSEYTYEVFE